MRRERIDAQIAEIRAALGPARAGQPGEPPAGKRNLSAAARKRMSEAQKRRWAAVSAEKQAETRSEDSKIGKRSAKPKGKAKGEEDFGEPVES